MTNLGTTEEVTQCDCCGKANLKKTVVFESEYGEILYYGVVCASKVVGDTIDKIKSDAKIADKTKVIFDMLKSAIGDTQINKIVNKAEKSGCDMHKLFSSYGKKISEFPTTYALGSKLMSF